MCIRDRATAAWKFGIPTSESHALIAGLSGAAIALHNGMSGINGAEWLKAVSYTHLYSDKNASHCIPKSELNAVFARAYKTLIDFGFIRSVDGLPMNFANATCCAKMLNNFVIAPNGDISKCEHLLNVEDEVIGNVSTGLRFNAAFARWTSTDIPDKCLECCYLPICQAGCATAEHRGFGYGRCAHIAFIHDAVITAANYLLKKGGEQHDGLAQEQRSFQ